MQFLLKILILYILFFYEVSAANSNVPCGNQAWDLMRNANDCHVKGYFPKSIEYGKKIIEKEKNNSRAYALIAMSYTRNNQHVEAIPYYSRAVELGAATFDFFGHYAISLDAVGDTEAAIKWNRRALEIVPDLVDVTKSLAIQLSRSEKKEEAINLLESFDATQRRLGRSERFKGEIMILKDGLK